MSKRIYVASPWVDRAQAIPLAEGLESMGHTITHKWWQYEGENQEKESYEFLRSCAMSDVYGVGSADVVIVLNTSKSEGKATEQGIAIALHKPIICITSAIKPSSNIFHYLPNYKHVKSVEEALEALANV